MEKIVPYVRQPPEITPGKPLYFATALTLGGFGTGVIATSHEGRPTKIEGNPDHPASLGATSIFVQASVLDLYDPDRAQTVLHGGEPSDWATFVSAMNDEMRAQKAKGGAGCAFSRERSLRRRSTRNCRRCWRSIPAAKWRQWEPVTRDNVREGARLAFRRRSSKRNTTSTRRRWSWRSTRIFCLRIRRACATRGNLRIAAGSRAGGNATMNRLYVAEPTPTITGAMADHRLPIAAGRDRRTRARAGRGTGLGIARQGRTRTTIGSRRRRRTFSAHAGKCIVIAGETQPPAVHALVHHINAALGNIGQTMTYTVAVEPSPVNQLASLRELAGEMKAGAVDLLVMIGGNPVYDAPGGSRISPRRCKR